jgi:hypothetical protein
MCFSLHARIVGPSLSRKKRLSAVIARKKTMEESALSPPATPCSSAVTLSVVAVLTWCFAASAVP